MQSTPRKPPPAGRKSAASRVEWVDYAKGICIVAVVMMYAAHHVHQIAGGTGWMQYVVDFAQPFRMPDFFLLAGLFVARVIDRPWRAFIDSKVLYFAYFYAIWVTFKFAFLEASRFATAGWAELIPQYLFLYVQPPTGPLWFIYILSLFFIVVRLVRDLPVPIVFAAAVALQVANLDTGAILVDKFAHYFVFFYAGYLFSGAIFRAAGWIGERRTTALALLVAWAVLNASLVRSGLAALPGVSLLCGFAGAFAVMLVSTLLHGVSAFGWLRYLGAHSIVVYLGFVVPLALLRRFVEPVTSAAGAGTATFAVMTLSIAGAVLLYWLVRPTPARILFERPAWATLGPAGDARMQKANT